MAEPFVIVALVLDALLGWPAWLYRFVGHPVGLFARVISACERALNRPEAGPVPGRAAGIATVVVLLVLAGGGAWLAARAAGTLAAPAGQIAQAIAIGLLAWPGLAQRSLYEHFARVRTALEARDIVAARKAVGMIVGRDTAELDEAGVARAAIESLAESLCDGIVAPLFWLIVGGLPGLWCYKAINTADSLIGHREAPYTWFGWAAARLDDVLNWLPARISGLLICIAGLRFGTARLAWRTMRRDHARHASPNAGWPEAAMAGVLGVRLAGPVSYENLQYDKPWIGDGEPAGAVAMGRALAVYFGSCATIWLVPVISVGANSIGAV